LIDFPTAQGPVPAVLQATKRGEVFVLDRVSGRPLTPVEERPAPQGPPPGERLAATQPFSTGLPSFGGGLVRERDLWGLTPLDQLWCRIKFKGARYDGPMTPPGLKGTIASPGYLGGMGWGGVAVDLDRKLMIVNSNRVANYVRLIPRAEVEAMGLTPKERARKHIALQTGTPYAVETAPFLSPLGVPCQEPPFGFLSAVDLSSRKLLWSRALGDARDSGPFNTALPVPIPMGAPNEGGALVTRSGLTFISATKERAFAAYDTLTGKQLWKTRLPAGGQANPMTYRSAKTGRQYVVLAAGGHPVMLTKQGNSIIAYSLPR
jgi:quinoprotein glucose dehydrogenase